MGRDVVFQRVGVVDRIDAGARGDTGDDQRSQGRVADGLREAAEVHRLAADGQAGQRIGTGNHEAALGGFRCGRRIRPVSKTFFVDCHRGIGDLRYVGVLVEGDGDLRLVGVAVGILDRIGEVILGARGHIVVGDVAVAAIGVDRQLAVEAIERRADIAAFARFAFLAGADADDRGTAIVAGFVGSTVGDVDVAAHLVHAGQHVAGGRQAFGHAVGIVIGGRAVILEVERAADIGGRRVGVAVLVRDRCGERNEVRSSQALAFVMRRTARRVHDRPLLVEGDRAGRIHRDLEDDLAQESRHRRRAGLADHLATDQEQKHRQAGRRIDEAAIGTGRAHAQRIAADRAGAVRTVVRREQAGEVRRGIRAEHGLVHRQRIGRGRFCRQRRAVVAEADIAAEVDRLGIRRGVAVLVGGGRRRTELHQVIAEHDKLVVIGRRGIGLGRVRDRQLLHKHHRAEIVIRHGEVEHHPGIGDGGGGNRAGAANDDLAVGAGRIKIDRLAVREETARIALVTHQVEAELRLEARERARAVGTEALVEREHVADIAEIVGVGAEARQGTGIVGGENRIRPVRRRDRGARHVVLDRDVERGRAGDPVAVRHRDGDRFADAVGVARGRVGADEVAGVVQRVLGEGVGVVAAGIDREQAERRHDIALRHHGEAGRQSELAGDRLGRRGGVAAGDRAEAEIAAFLRLVEGRFVHFAGERLDLDHLEREALLVGEGVVGGVRFRTVGRGVGCRHLDLAADRAGEGTGHIDLQRGDGRRDIGRCDDVGLVGEIAGIQRHRGAGGREGRPRRQRIVQHDLGGENFGTVAVHAAVAGPDLAISEVRTVAAVIAGVFQAAGELQAVAFRDAVGRHDLAAAAGHIEPLIQHRIDVDVDGLGDRVRREGGIGPVLRRRHHRDIGQRVVNDVAVGISRRLQHHSHIGRVARVARHREHTGRVAARRAGSRRHIDRPARRHQIAQLREGQRRHLVRRIARRARHRERQKVVFLDDARVAHQIGRDARRQNLARHRQREVGTVRLRVVGKVRLAAVDDRFLGHRRDGAVNDAIVTGRNHGVDLGDRRQEIRVAGGAEEPGTAVSRAFGERSACRRADQLQVDAGGIVRRIDHDLEFGDILRAVAIHAAIAGEGEAAAGHGGAEAEIDRLAAIGFVALGVGACHVGIFVEHRVDHGGDVLAARGRGGTVDHRRDDAERRVGVGIGRRCRREGADHGLAGKGRHADGEDATHKGRHAGDGAGA